MHRRAPGARKTRRAITKLLKTKGPIDSAQLAERLGLTAMAVRQHLYALQREGLVSAEERPCRWTAGEILETDTQRNSIVS